MLGIHDLPLFVLTGLLLNLLPGPDSLLIMTRSATQGWRAGFLTNVLNPKVALFFLALVPQFINTDAPNKALAFIVLGCIFNVNGMLWCNALSLFTARVSSRIKLHPAVSLWLGRATGGLFVWLGVRLALSEQS